MIDFRYHLVSLISVFMALAIGVILGAGPLRDAIGSQLDDQISVLRDQKNELRDELDLAEELIEFDGTYLQALAPDLLSDQLGGKGVAIVNLDGPGLIAEGVLTGLEETIELADGHVTTIIHLQDSWTNPEEAGARSATADRLGEEIDGWVASDQPEEVLARALGQALTQVNLLESTSRSEQALVLEEVLVSSGLIDVGREDTRPADVVLAITSRGPVPVGVQLDVADEYAAVTLGHVFTIRGLAGITPTVVAGPASRGDDLIARLTGEDINSMSTYSGVNRVPGLIALPLVLAHAEQSSFGHYGEGNHVDAPLPPRIEVPNEDPVLSDPTPGSEGNDLSDDTSEEEAGE